MSDANKSTLQRANAAVAAGDNEGFLACCTDDIVWTTVGGESVRGKDAVRRLMQESYRQPPRFTVEALIGDGDMVVAIGEIEAVGDEGQTTRNAYSDVWRFRDGRMAELRAFVVELPNA